MAAVSWGLGWLGEHGFVENLKVVGHRVVDGGDRFFGPTLIDDEVVATIEELSHSALLIKT